MQITVGMTQARRDFEDLCDRVVAGDEVIITRWGRPVAKMIRDPNYRPSADQTVASKHKEPVRSWDQVVASSSLGLLRD